MNPRVQAVSELARTMPNSPEGMASYADLSDDLQMAVLHESIDRHTVATALLALAGTVTVMLAWALANTGAMPGGDQWHVAHRIAVGALGAAATTAVIIRLRVLLTTSVALLLASECGEPLR